jgi:CrcB protein
MPNVLWVALGGALGSAARYMLSDLVQRATTLYLPVGTFVVNVAGSMLVGVLTGITLASDPLEHEGVRLFLIVGFCGGFTTFSAFSHETYALIRAGQVGWAGLNAGAHLAAGLVAVWLGLAAARAL